MALGAHSTPDAFYAPFTLPFVVDDAPQSSEDGSGLHSPTFMDTEPHDAHNPRRDCTSPLRLIATVPER